MPSLGGLSYRHIDLEGCIPCLYRQDGVHLSDVRQDIFNIGLQSDIEMASVVGEADLGGVLVKCYNVGYGSSSKNWAKSLK